MIQPTAVPTLACDASSAFLLASRPQFCCVDQDGTPTSELQQLDRLMQMCDLMLTPVVDPDHESQWEWPAEGFTDYFAQYKAPAWVNYWQRAWCRVEAMLAASEPFESDAARGQTDRASLFRGVLRAAISTGRRPHGIYGNKQVDSKRPVFFLPPLTHATLARYEPATGQLTSEADRETIRVLEHKAKSKVSDIKVGYQGGMDEQGRPHGYGCRWYDDGGYYEGEWRSGSRHGVGTMRWPSFNLYVGSWADDTYDGMGTMWDAAGGIYHGPYVRDKKHGLDCIQMYAHGMIYEGGYENGKKTWVSSDGRPFAAEQDRPIGAEEWAVKVRAFVAEMPAKLRRGSLLRQKSFIG